MKTVLTFGVFDLLHIGHVLLFKKAKELSEGGQLIVAVQESDFILKYKPDTELVIDTSTRMFMVNSINMWTKL